MYKLRMIGAIILVLFTIKVIAQEEVPRDTVLVLMHKTKDKSKFIKEGKKITCWNSDQTKYKGELTKINENSLEVDGKVIGFSDINQIRAKSVGLKVAQVAGDIVLVTGTIVSCYGGYLVIHGYTIQSTDACGSAFSITFGIVIMAVGIPAIVIGAIPRAIVGKKYNLSDDWTIKMGTVPDKKAERKLKK